MAKQLNMIKKREGGIRKPDYYGEHDYNAHDDDDYEYSHESERARLTRST